MMPTAKTPPKSTHQLVLSTIALINELVEIMAAEPDLVIKRQLEAHQLLLKRKQKLTMDYRTNMKALIAQPEILKQLPDDRRRALKTACQRLAESVDKNARMLRTAVLATQRLVQNIIALVKSEVLPKSGYTNPHTAHLVLGTYSPTCTPVAVNRTV